MKQGAFWIVWGLIFILAAALRLNDLDVRPMHGDEANQAVKAELLLEDGVYIYDPHEHHGPTLYYAARIVQGVLGIHSAADTTKWSYRIVPVLFSLGILLLLLAMRKQLGYAATCWATLFIGVSHAHVYYSRYFIQESLLLFFILLAIYAGFVYLQKPGALRAILFGCALGLIHATKETSVLIYAAMGVGFFCFITLALYHDRKVFYWPMATPVNRTELERSFLQRVILPLKAQIPLLIMGFAIIIIVLFSAFFTHLRGPLDAFLTYISYTERAEGMGSVANHDKPWFYYFQILGWYMRPHSPFVWTEATFLILGLFGMVWGLMRNTTDVEIEHTIQWHRFFTGFALTLTLLYTLIPYKTPWNLLTFYLPVLILAGLVMAEVGHRFIKGGGASRILYGLLILLVVAGTAHHARQTYLGTTTYRADVRNPYVYAHTATALENKLVALIEDCTALHKDGHAMRIDLMKPNGDYWPLPWYLRKHTQVGYWVKPPPEITADIIITDNATRDYVLGEVGNRYKVLNHSLRPEVNLYTFIENDLWEAYIETRR